MRVDRMRASRAYPRPSVRWSSPLCPWRRCYFPYNEALVKPRSNKGAFVEFAAQQDRGALRGKNEVSFLWCLRGGGVAAKNKQTAAA